MLAQGETAVENSHSSNNSLIYNDCPAAIWGQNINKGYGSGKKKVQILNDLNITVPRGSIYGLLGPSGCGKTTLLRSVIGRLKIDSGNLVVLGDKPGARGHQVPGKMVGYMPQETALFPDLTIAETLKYFGALTGMKSDLINRRTKFLVEFLTLPDKDRLVAQLSGGQMRRVSFAVALLHEPELLILDEPTVGVDPLLRERIWDHLINITSHTRNQTTIILTTHYIEEARQADKVGFMRNGRILAEDVPNDIIQRCKMNSLEDVFLKLCQEDIEGTPPDLVVPDPKMTHPNLFHGSSWPTNLEQYLKLCIDNEFQEIFDKPSKNVSPRKSSRRRVNSSEEDDEPLLTEHKVVQQIRQEVHHHSPCLPFGMPSGKNILAQFIKNLQLMRRNIGFLLFQFILPVVQIMLFCVCIGNDPFNLHVAVINNDVGLLGMNMGQMFLNALDKNSISQVNYTTRGYQDAYSSVQQGKTWGIIMMDKNFSVDLFQRYNTKNVSDAVIEGSSIKIQLDTTNQQVYLVLVQKITQGFQKFSKDLLNKTGLNPKLADLPIQMLTPVYGDSDATFTEFMAPGVIISITFFLATGMTTLVFVMDKKMGMFDRCLASGMLSFEIMIAHMFTQMLVVVVQVALLLIFVLLVFSIPCKGPLIWVIILVLLLGFCGMALGVLYAAMCTNENSAIQLALGSYFPLILISGIIWPIEAIPEWLRYISYCTPMTYACQAMRCLLSRGLDITFHTVWRGYLVSSAWCVGLVIVGGIILRVKE